MPAGQITLGELVEKEVIPGPQRFRRQYLWCLRRGSVSPRKYAGFAHSRSRSYGSPARWLQPRLCSAENALETGSGTHSRAPPSRTSGKLIGESGVLLWHFLFSRETGGLCWTAKVGATTPLAWRPVVWDHDPDKIDRSKVKRLHETCFSPLRTC